MPVRSPMRTPMQPPPLHAISPAQRSSTEYNDDDNNAREVTYRGKHLTAEDVQNISRLFVDVSSVDLSHNSLDCIPKGLPPTLLSINLSFNRFHNLMGFENIRSIRMLCLSHNHIESTWGLAMMTNLEYLDISYNKLRVIEGLETLTNLVTLLLHNNNIKTFAHIRPLSFNKSLQIVNLQSNPVSGLQKYRGFMQQILPSLEHLDNVSLHRRDRHQPIYDYSTQYVQRQTHPNRPYLLWSETASRWGALERHTPPPAPPPQIIEEPSPLPWRRPPDVAPRPWKGKALLDSCKKIPPSAKAAVDKINRSPNITNTTANDIIVHNSEWDKYSRPDSPPKKHRSAGSAKKSLRRSTTASSATSVASAPSTPSVASPPSPYKYKVTLGTSPNNKTDKKQQRTLQYQHSQSFIHSNSFHRSTSTLSDSPEHLSFDAAPPILSSPTLRGRMAIQARHVRDYGKSEDAAVNELFREYRNLSVTDLNRPPPPPLPCDHFPERNDTVEDHIEEDDFDDDHSNSSFSTAASNYAPSVHSISDDVRNVALHIYYEQKKDTLMQLQQRRRMEQLRSSKA